MNYSIDELEIIDTLLKKNKKLWLCGDKKRKWGTYNIPEYITHLYLQCCNRKMFDNKVLNKLPASLEFLSIMIDLIDEPLTNLPPNLKHLEINFEYVNNISLDFLPIGLETLVLIYINNGNNDNNGNNGNVIKNTTFPPKLKTLVIEFEYIPKIIPIIPTLYNLPTTLEYLYIRGANGSQQGIKDYIPNVNIIYH
jgi:hypothetical protein